MITNRKKKILILGAGVEQTIAIKTARELGYYVVALDGNPLAQGKDFADVFVNIDINCVGSITSVARQFEVDGVFCHGVEIPDVVAAVAESLGLPGNSRDVAENATVKGRRIEILQSAGVRVPEHWMCPDKNSVFELDIPPEKYPLVIKPVDAAGARGVILVASEIELREAYDIAVRFSTRSGVLVERYLTGPQISTEAFVTPESVVTYAFADRNYDSSEEFKPYFVEDGINFPSALSKEKQNIVIQETVKAIRALGIEFGAAKGDVILHNNEPYIIEMAARTSGGWFSVGSIPAATGINPLIPLLQISVGDVPDLTKLEPLFFKGCAQRYWIPKRDGVLKRVTGLDLLEHLESVEIFEHFFPPDGTFIKKSTNHAERYAQVICTARTRQQAIINARQAISAIDVEFE